MANRFHFENRFSTPSPHRAETDDLFAATRMSFGDHLEELRGCLWRSVGGFGAVLFLVFALDFTGFITGTRLGIARPVLAFISRPVEKELESFYGRRVQKVLANLEKDARLRSIDQPTPFYRIGVWRAQLLAVLERQPVSQVNSLPAPRVKRDTQGIDEAGAVAIPDEDIYRLWVRAEEPLREAAYHQEAERQVGRRPTLATMGAMEGMMAYLQVAMACSIALACPWFFWQAWSFVASGLYPHERRPILSYLPLSVALLAAGICVCQIWVIPKAVETLLGFNEWLDLEPELRLKEWLGFAVWMPLAFGFSFETPLVMLLLERIGLMSTDAYRRNRRLAWLIMSAVAAIVTPPFDVMSMLFLWIVLGFLYELGIIFCSWPSREAGTIPGL